MDDRALSWMHLLPADQRISPWNVPNAVLKLLADRTNPQGTTWLGWHPTMTQLPPLASFEAVVLVNPRGIPSAWLHKQGFTHIRSFAVVPNLREARWFMSLDSKPVTLRAWDMYTPFRERARLRKAIAKLLARSGTMHYVTDRLVVAQRHQPPLEAALTRAVQTDRFNLSIASGTMGPRRKLTMQITRHDGAVLAYAKCADRPETGALIRQEVQLLLHLQQSTLHHGIVPRVLAHGPHQHGYLLVSTPLTEHRLPSSLSLTPRHIAVLQEFAQRTHTRTTQDVVQDLQQRLDALHPHLDAPWYGRLADAAALLLRLPDVAALPTVLAHGDFAPWNVSVERDTGQLAIFDWEHGQISQTLLWDAFHFKTQVDILVRHRSATTSVTTTIAELMASPLVHQWDLSSAQVHALYVSYLLGSSVQWFEDRLVPAASVAFDDAAQVLRGKMLDLTVHIVRRLTAQPRRTTQPLSSGTASVG